jgi:cysteine desulfurase
MTGSYYFDHAASAPRRAEVADAMAPWLSGVVGNPSAAHHAARRARKAIEEAREIVAQFVGGPVHEVIFTGGGSESTHLAIVGTTRAFLLRHGRANIVMSAIEHHAVSSAAESLARGDERVTLRVMGCHPNGETKVEEARALVDEFTAVVSMMSANNETGIIQPLSALVSMAKGAVAGGATVHTDAIASAPFVDLSFATEAADLVSLCAHKLGGPVNAGALIVRRPVALEAVVPGGGQERGHRGGTVDVAAAVGFAAACQATARDRVRTWEHVSQLQERLVAQVRQLPEVVVTGLDVGRLPGTVHVMAHGVSSEEILFLLDVDGVCASAGAACSSGAQIGSHVMAAMDIGAAWSGGAVRFSMGAETTADEVDYVAASFARALERLRAGR